MVGKGSVRLGLALGLGVGAEGRSGCTVCCCDLEPKREDGGGGNLAVVLAVQADCPNLPQGGWDGAALPEETLECGDLPRPRPAVVEEGPPRMLGSHAGDRERCCCC